MDCNNNLYVCKDTQPEAGEKEYEQFTAARVEVARLGDLAWEQGPMNSPRAANDGKTTIEKGTYSGSLEKQTDGTRKVVGDIHNTNA